MRILTLSAGWGGGLGGGMIGIEPGRSDCQEDKQLGWGGGGGGGAELR